MRSLPLSRTCLVFATSIVLAVSACGSSESLGSGGGGTVEAVTEQQVVEHYAEGVHASYEASLSSAVRMDEAIDSFIADPSDESLNIARTTWLAARVDYGPTEAFRFYDGPIDDPDSGPEGQLNAWPMDENYVDYVEGDDTAGIINDAIGFPTISADVLAEANESGGETNISTGWHAIEFLLWGQDLSLEGPGDRPVADYTTNPNADRRADYLAAISDLLVADLGTLVSAWAPDSQNYRQEFVALDSNEALRRMITGAGELSRGELAGERMNVAFEARSQEDEHSCFSDNTHNDIIGNAAGVEMVLSGDFPNSPGVGILDLVRAKDPGVADNLKAALATTRAEAGKIEAPFDQHLVEGVSDDDPGRAQVATTISVLGAQTDLIVDSATVLGVSIEVS